MTYQKTITSQIEVVDKNSNISKEVKDIILEKLSETKSYKQIAKEEKVSVNTVIRVLETASIQRQTEIDTSVIYIDEFKGNIEKEKYQLAIYDKNHKLIDILRNRHSQTIKNTIKEFKIQPQVVVMDMFKPFRSVINSNIVQSEIVADKYHVVRQGIWALRDLRVELFNKDNQKYKKLKKYWKLLSKNPVSQFSQRQKEILKEILKIDKTLKKMYSIIKEFYKMFESKTVSVMYRRIGKVIEKLKVLNIKQSIKLADTIENWKKEIINIVEYKINNGFVEGNNNKIKVIKRVSYGLRNYERFRKLIYLRLCNS